jgi:polyisoprenoid-binding protein YceI
MLARSLHRLASNRSAPRKEDRAMEAPSEEACWTIDPERSSLCFSVRHALLGEIRGHFRCWGGSVVRARGDASRVAVHVWAELSSLDAGTRAHTDAILDTELFDVHWEPAVVFDSERCEVSEGGHAVLVGWLSLHTFRKRIEVSVDVTPTDDGRAQARLVGNARATLDRRTFGLRRRARARDWLSERLVDRDVQVTAHVELRRDASAAPPPAITGPTAASDWAA